MAKKETKFTWLDIFGIIICIALIICAVLSFITAWQLYQESSEISKLEWQYYCEIYNEDRFLLIQQHPEIEGKLEPLNCTEFGK